MMSKRLYGAALMASIVIPATLQGCSSDNPLCCTEFKSGATIEAGIQGDASAQVAVQAIADFSGIASAAIEDLTTACRSIATDLEADKAQRDAAEQNGDKQKKMEAYCQLAVSAIGSVKAKAGGTFKLVAKPPACQASFSAKANCQAKCSGGAQCDVQAEPPRCEGGKLEVSCSGSCKGEANVKIKCEGTCSGKCSGSCTAKGGVAVKCDGKCEGTCKAAGGGGNNGIQADGSCKGECEGTCTARAEAPALECSGSCQGECDASCEASGGASVKCDGKCEGTAEPLKCEGGTLKGGCKVEAKCDANCDASVSAKAECTPPQIAFELSGTADVNAAGKLRSTLEANFGVVLAFQARLEGMAKLTGTIGGNASAVASIKASCIPVVVGAAADAVADVAAAGKVTASLAGSIGS